MQTSGEKPPDPRHWPKAAVGAFLACPRPSQGAGGGGEWSGWEELREVTGTDPKRPRGTRGHGHTSGAPLQATTMTGLEMTVARCWAGAEEWCAGAGPGYPVQPAPGFLSCVWGGRDGQGRCLHGAGAAITCGGKAVQTGGQGRLGAQSRAC